MRKKYARKSQHPTRTKAINLRVDPKLWRTVKAFSKSEMVTIEDVTEAALLSYIKEHSHATPA